MHGLYLLWWVEERHVPAAIVAAILAAGDLAVLAFELPTGWFADRFGHRVSLIAGSIIQAVGMLWCWLGEGVPGLLTATLLLAAADGFRSGADQALLYRSCAALRREEAFQRIEARSNALEIVALLALLLTGGVVVSQWGFAAAWIAETVLSTIGIGLAWAMTEPPPAPLDEDEASAPAGTLLSPRLLLVMLPAAFVVGGSSAASFLAQTTGASGPAEVTMVVAFITAAEAAGSFMSARLRANGARVHLAIGAAGAGLAGLALAWPAAIAWAAAGLAFLAGLAEPLRDTAIQRLAPDGARARAASVASACSMAFSALMLPLAGVWQSGRRPRRAGR